MWRVRGSSDRRRVHGRLSVAPTEVPPTCWVRTRRKAGSAVGSATRWS